MIFADTDGQSSRTADITKAARTCLHAPTCRSESSRLSHVVLSTGSTRRCTRRTLVEVTITILFDARCYRTPTDPGNHEAREEGTHARRVSKRHERYSRKMAQKRRELSLQFNVYQSGALPPETTYISAFDGSSSALCWTSRKDKKQKQVESRQHHGHQHQHKHQQ